LKLVPLVALISAIVMAQATTAGAATAFVTPAAGDVSEALHFVAASGEANDVSVTFGSSGFDVRDTGAPITPGAGCVAVTANLVECSVEGEESTEIKAALGDGNDFLTVDVATAGGVLRGGDGKDRIRGSDDEYSYERLLGGAGDDSLFGRGGNDILDGGTGSDDLSGGTSCAAGTAGICTTNEDAVSYASRTGQIHATADGLDSDDGRPQEDDTIMPDVERIIGGAGNDRLGGTTTNFTFGDNIPHLVGMTLEGRGGNDRLVGGRAPDLLAGGPGDDLLRGGDRGDGLNGGGGGDRLIGQSGRDILRGQKGPDQLLARDGQRDRVNGGSGSDKAAVDPTLDRVRGVEELL
jgi:Ca2+-binding RTX toxin-like protein